MIAGQINRSDTINHTSVPSVATSGVEGTKEGKHETLAWGRLGLGTGEVRALTRCWFIPSRAALMLSLTRIRSECVHLVRLDSDGIWWCVVGVEGDERQGGHA